MTEARDRDVHDGGEPYPLKEPDASLGDLMGRLTGELGGLLNDHIRLARIEVMEDAKRAGRGAGLMGGAGVAGWLAALILSLALAWGLAEVMETWLAFLIVGAVWVITAIVLGVTGKKEFDRIRPVAQETTEELEKDKEWISRQTN